MDKELNLYGAPGIGDILWPLVKILPNTNKSINLHVWPRDNYSAKFLLDIEGINSVNQWSDTKKYLNNFNNYEKECESIYNKTYKRNSDFLEKDNDIFLVANKFLESGKRIESYLPQLSTGFKVPWKFDKQLYNEAVKVSKGRSIVIYTSNVKNNNISPNCINDWTDKRWIDLIRQIKDNWPDANIKWIGSSNDITLKEKIEKEKIPDITYYIDQSAKFIIPLLEHCKCFISYQSGLSCISAMEAIPTCMLYFNHLDKLRYSFCHPSVLNNDKMYKPYMFNELQTNDPIINWVKYHF